MKITIMTTFLLLLLCIGASLASEVDGARENHRRDDVTSDVTNKLLTSPHLREKRFLSFLKKLIRPVRKAVETVLDKSKNLITKLPFGKLKNTELSKTLNKYIRMAAQGSKDAKGILASSLPLLVDLGESGLNIALAISGLLDLDPQPVDNSEEKVSRDDLLPLLLALKNTGTSVTCSGWIMISGIFLALAGVIL